MSHPGFPMLTIVVGGTISEAQMRDIAENLKDEILDVKNIASVPDIRTP